MLRRARDGEAGLFPELAKARGGRIQRGVEWGQVVAGVPRAAVEQQEVASGPPQRQAALHCAGSRAKQRGRDVGDDCWTCL